jgi:uncharacterized protein
MGLPEAKEANLRKILVDMGSVLVAYSGGVDSTYLLKVASDVLGDRAQGVIAASPTFPQEEFDEALKVAKDFNLPVTSIWIDEFEDESFVSNPTNRCYHCKSGLFSRLVPLARVRGLAWVVDGFNADDVGDYRPGYQAAKEAGVRHPLMEAGLTKAEIRELSRRLGLPTWDKPSFACLSSRIPYGTRITPEAIARIGAAERFLRELGFRQVRVRHHDHIARIEVELQDMIRLADPALSQRVVARLRELGYVYVTMDLAGYRTGSMNAPLKVQRRGGN